MKRTRNLAGLHWNVLLALIVVVSACGGMIRSFGQDVEVANISKVPRTGLLMFGAKWAGPAQEMRPIIAKLQSEDPTLVRYVDIDVEHELARQYNVNSIPCFVLLADDREIKRTIGLTTEQLLREMLALLPEITHAQKRQHLEVAINKLKDAKSEDAKRTTVVEVETLLSKEFDDAVQRREKQLAEVERRIQTLRSQLEKQKTSRNAIIGLRLKILINRAEGLGFPDGNGSSESLEFLGRVLDGFDGPPVAPDNNSAR